MLVGRLGAIRPVEHGPLVQAVAVPDGWPFARRGESGAAALQCSETLLRELSRIICAVALDAAPEPLSVVLRCLDGHADGRAPSPKVRGRAQIATVIRKYEIQQRVVARPCCSDVRCSAEQFRDSREVALGLRVPAGAGDDRRDPQHD